MVRLSNIIKKALPSKRKIIYDIDRTPTEVIHEKDLDLDLRSTSDDGSAREKRKN
jgi:hypothetical protein